MLFQSVRARIGQLVAGSGGLLALAGAIFMATLAYDFLSTERTIATVTELGSTCKGHLKARSGGKHWFWVNCAVRDDLEARGTPVRSEPYAKLSFVGRDGIARTASPSFSKLRRTTARVGDQIAIRFRGSRRPYITTDPPAAHVLIGLMILLAGLMVRWFGSAMRPRTGLPRHAPAEGLAPATDDHAAQPTFAGRTRQRGKPGSKGARQATSMPARTPGQRPARINAVQREPRWFG